jgi:hypothetical protein
MVRIDLGPRENPALAEQTLAGSKATLEITPTLVVGLGGTGMRVLSLFKQRMLSLCGPDAPIAYLGIDTDGEEGLPGAPLNRDEFALCECVQAPAVVRNLDSYPAVKEWWHLDMDPGVIHKGAKMKRAVGRLACFYNYREEIRWRLDNQIKRLQRLERPSVSVPFEVRKRSLRVYVVGSLSGGTGGGFFFDVAMAVRDAISRAIGPSVNPIVVGVIVLPRGFISLMPLEFMRHKVQANFYAGLKEIEYLSTHYAEFKLTLEQLPFQVEKPPFDTVYLLDTLNQEGKNIESTDRLHSMIASEMCVEVYSSITGHVESVLVNMEDETAKVLHGKRCFYGSFATAALVIPGHKVLDYCVLEYAREKLTDSILDAKPGNVRAEDEVNNLLTNMNVLRRDEEYLTQSLKEAATAGKTTSVLETIPASKAKDVPRIARTEWGKLEDRKRGLEAARAALEASEELTKNKLIGEIRAYFERQLSAQGGRCGLDFLIRVARNLQSRLDQLADEVYKRAGQLPDANAALKAAKDAYRNSQKASGKRFPWSGDSGQIVRYEDFAQNCNNWSEVVLNGVSLEVARKTLLALREEVRLIKRGFKEMAAQVNQACQTLKSAAVRMKESVEGAASKYDYVLVESVLGPEDFEPIYQELRQKAKLPAIDVHLIPKDGTLTSWASLYVSNLQTLLNEQLFPAIETAFAPLVSQMDILTAAQKYSDIPVKQWVKRAIEQCSPFCNFDPVKVPGGYYHETYVGVPNAQERRYQDAVGDVKPAKIVSTGNSNEILIHTLMTALPAFAVTGLAQYRQMYEYMSAQAKRDPQLHVHLDRRWAATDALPDLFPDGK